MSRGLDLLIGTVAIIVAGMMIGFAFGLDLWHSITLGLGLYFVFWGIIVIIFPRRHP